MTDEYAGMRQRLVEAALEIGEQFTLEKAWTRGPLELAREYAEDLFGVECTVIWDRERPGVLKIIPHFPAFLVTIRFDPVDSDEAELDEGGEDDVTDS